METTIHSPVNVETRRTADIRPGDTVRVWQKVQEKNKTRLQKFEGLVIARKHGTEPGATFTVRRTASGVGVERIFPLYSPMIDSIEVVRRSKARRAKLYYVRDKAAKEVRKKMKRIRFAGAVISGERDEPDTPSEAEEQIAEEERRERTQEEEAKETEQPVEEAASTEEGSGQKQEPKEEAKE